MQLPLALLFVSTLFAESLAQATPTVCYSALATVRSTNLLGVPLGAPSTLTGRTVTSACAPSSACGATVRASGAPSTGTIVSGIVTETVVAVTVTVRSQASMRRRVIDF